MDVQKIIKDGVMRDMTEEDIEELMGNSPRIEARDVRRQRDVLLKDSDWTQTLDTPLTPEQKLAWATYRQALRDVPQQSGFPQNIVWPVKPE